MKVIKATQQMLETRTLVLGFQGENLRTQLRIDCSPTFAEYPNATPALAIKPPTGETYPVFVERDGNEVVWDIVANNLVLKGDGELQLTFYKDNVIAKTVIGTIRVNRSLQIDGEMPDVVATWIENANRKLAEVDAQIVELEGMVETATDAAERAAESAEIATEEAVHAEGSAETATAKATEATTAAGTATAKAAEAQTAAQTATAKATAAAESERIATAKAGEATTAAETATAKAEQATEAAETSTEKAGDASVSATAAHASEINAAESADDALSAEVGANAAKRAAEGSATQAGASAQNAGIAAQTATQKATEATQSATDAEIFAGTATTKAEEAAASAQAASDAKTAVEQTAEQLADSLEQIDQNTQDIAELDERKANIDGYYPDMTVGNAEQLNSSKYVENSEPYTLRTSGGSADIGNREYVDAVVGGTLAWNQAVRDEASPNETDFADVVTVTDAVEDAAGVKVKIEPVQDLHGYDSPWPGGSGKNLAQITAETIVKPSWYTGGWEGVSVNANGGITQTRTYQQGGAGGFVVKLPEGDYTFSMEFTGTTQQCMLHIASWNGSEQTTIIPNNGMNKNGNLHYLQFTIPADSVEVSVRPTIWSGNLTYDLNRIQIEVGSSATAYEPYSNICPITGWDGVKVTRTGKNLVNARDMSGITTQTPIARDISLPAGQYTISAYIKNDGSASAAVRVVDKNVIITTTGYTTETTATLVSRQFTLESATDTLMIFVVGSAAGYNASVSKVQLELGSTATDYEAYAGQTYDITLPSEAGTVYGGELTVNADGSGSLVVDRASVDISTLNFSPSSPDIHVFRSDSLASIIGQTELNTEAGTSKCSAFEIMAFGPISASDNGRFAVASKQSSSHGRVVFIDHRYSSVSDFVNGNAGVQLVYPLATPVAYTLAAAQVTTLLGTNNVWADTGDLALTYTGTDEHLTLEIGKKYLTRISGTDSMLLGSGQEITAAKGTDNVFDLTQMFGTAVADYVYGQGAAFFRKWFPNAVYPYNAGELKHVEGLSAHEMVGFNVFDKSDIKTGVYIADGDGSEISATGAIATGWIPVIGGASYYIKHDATSGNWGAWYNADKAYISGTGKGLRTAPVNAAYLRFTVKNNASSLGSPDTLCINLAHNNSRNGEYEPYEKHSYPLDSTVVLRGIPKVDANGVYWDGDRYLPDGTVERRYGVVDLGTLNWEKVTTISNNYRFRAVLNVTGAANNTNGNLLCEKYQAITGNETYAGLAVGIAVYSGNGYVFVYDPTYTDAASFKAAVSGVLLVYELVTPTTETAQPYHSTQWVSDWGTEEFVSTSIVPVGTETRYPANLRDKLQHLPDAASGNGSYLITQTDGQMVLTPFPAPPSTAGNYVLKATVVNGVATYTWEVAT